MMMNDGPSNAAAPSDAPAAAPADARDRPKVLIFIVCYTAEDAIAAVLDRIPPHVLASSYYDTEILVIYGGSKDRVFSIVRERENKSLKVRLMHNQTNLGYGGNQKLGYLYAIKEGFDVVVLVHGDGRYAPEMVDEMVRPILDDQADVVLGSPRRGAPLHKWVGNQLLTKIQNTLLGMNLTEYHTGFRSYRVRSLARVPFETNSDYLDFDTDITIQLSDTKQRFQELSVPEFHGRERSRGMGLRYAYLTLKSTVVSRMQRLGIFYSRKFHYISTNEKYSLKLGFPSSHEFALARAAAGATIVDLGSGPGLMSAQLAERNCRAVAIDAHITAECRQRAHLAIEADLDSYDFKLPVEPIDTVFALDIIEHLKSPENMLTALRSATCGDSPDIVITTGNVGFFLVRLNLLFGNFNYGERGILDLTHTRLFTFASLERVLHETGYEILEVAGIPAPFPAALGPGTLGKALLGLNQLLIHLSRGLFAYQIAIVARPKPTTTLLLSRAEVFGCGSVS